MNLFSAPLQAPIGLPLDTETKTQLVSYLSNGRVLVAARTQTPDEHDPSGPPITVATLTDGTYIWSNHFTAYVKRHDLQVPERLLAAAAANNFTVPDISDAQLDAIREQLRSGKVLDLDPGAGRLQGSGNE